jgi:hypothetical protein
MEFAARMFVPVWKAVGGTKTLWYARYEAIREAEMKQAHKIKQDAKRR